MRGHYKDLKDLYEGNVQGDEETRALWDLLNSNDWFKFSVNAIWRKRRNEEYNDGQLKTAWEEFTKAFKKENTMVCNKNFFKNHGVKLSCLKWNQGRPVHTKSSRQAIFEEHASLTFLNVVGNCFDYRLFYGHIHTGTQLRDCLKKMI